jgi:nitrogen regulatory protein PII
MKKIEAIFKPFKLDEIKEVLAIPRVSLLEVKGAGCHQVRIRQYRGGSHCSDARNDTSFRRSLRR